MSQEISPRQTLAPKAEWRLTGKHVLAMLIAFFAVIFAVNFGMMWVAIQTMPGLDVKSSYEASQNFNRQLDAISSQDGRGWQVDVRMPTTGKGLIELVLHDKSGALLSGLQVEARFERPTDKRLDIALPLNAKAQGQYWAPLPDLMPGQWDLVIEISEKGQRAHVSKRRIQVKGS
jgi:nitrogen fixation protein FixH